MENMEEYIAQIEAARLAAESESREDEPITIRASSLPDLLDCPARWQARNELLVERRTSLSAWIGSAFHRACASIDEGKNYSISHYVGEFMDDLWEFPNDAAFEPEELRAYDVKNIAIKLLSDYRDTVRTIGLEFLAVEMRMTPIETHGLRLTGATDRVYRKDGKVGILDIKTGSRAVGTDGSVNAVPHRPQLAVYKLMAKSVFKMTDDAPSIILGLNVGKKATSARVGVGTTVVSSEYTDELLETVRFILSKRMFYGNPRSMLCSAKFCERFESCPWRQ